MHDPTTSRDSSGFDEKLDGPRKTPDLESALRKDVVYKHI
jgi:hypothetical protein